MSGDIPLLKRLANYGQNGHKTPILGYEIANLLAGYTSLVDLLPNTDKAAICEPLISERTPLSHRRLKQHIERDFDLRTFGIPYGQRVAVILPNGPELATCLLAVCSKWCAAPINTTNTWQEIKSELQSTRAVAMIILTGTSTNEAALKAADETGIGVIALRTLGSISGLFHMTQLRRINLTVHGDPDSVAKTTLPAFVDYPNLQLHHPEIVLLLHTSGTSGNKKLVAYSLDMVVIGVACIVASWNLKPSDCCLNMMPLFHIGGIMRNVFSPILSGGAVVTCSGFDPLLFWDVLYAGVEQKKEAKKAQNRGHIQQVQVRMPKVTWYYASPTMHHAILNESERRPTPLPIRSVRYVANAAGGLLPVLAQRLRDTFQAVILTSYGMTECMPISSPPQHYALSPGGTSGSFVGPEVCIADEETLQECAVGSKGNIFVRGPPCFGGYQLQQSSLDLPNAEASSHTDADPTASCFFNLQGRGPGWFNTGDMGSVDSRGYLFISGRSKEIINRGGETISPFEIEEALQQHPLVREVLAFSAPHDQFQETVGVWLVMKAEAAATRLDLPTLHTFLQTRLHRSKWPQVLVYAENVPKNAANKVLRIRLSERLHLSAVDEESAPSSRLFEADCPPVGTSLSTPIVQRSVSRDLTVTETVFARLFAEETKQQTIHVRAVTLDLPSQPHAIVLCVFDDSVASSSSSAPPSSTSLFSGAALERVQRRALDSLHAYLCPAHLYPLPRTLRDASEEVLQQEAAQCFLQRHVLAPRNAVEVQVERIWRTMLGAPQPLSVTSSFFELGGDSLKAGQVVGAMRQTLRVPLSVADLFTAPTIAQISVKISTSKSIGSPLLASLQQQQHHQQHQLPHPLHEELELLEAPEKPSSTRSSSAALAAASTTCPDDATPEAVVVARSEERRKLGAQMQSTQQDAEQHKREHLQKEFATWHFTSLYSSESLSCLCVQALPLLLVYPLRRLAIWFLIAVPWIYAMRQGWGRFISLLFAMFAARVVMGLGFPLLGIWTKWLLIGRYKAGRYPLWGTMYLRWWLTEQIVHILGRGFFRDDLPLIGPHLVRWYYILMGAQIGRNVKIHKDAQLGQADLLCIGDDVVLDNCIARPFSLEEGHFVLLPIVIGDRCCVGAKSVVAAGSTLSADTCLGPLSSSHESETDSDPKYRAYCRPGFASPSLGLILCCGVPILLAVLAVSFLPWFLMLKLMVYCAEVEGWYQRDLRSVYHAFLWWITPQRLCFFLALRVVKRCIVPFVRLGCVLLVKWQVIGVFTPLQRHAKTTDWQRFRYWLMHKLLPGGSLGGVTKLVGTHYEVVSIIYRLLGAKVGQRVYWPGSGLEIVEFDLLEVGDDVVFGSRSAVFTSSSTCSKRVVLEAGAMVADRCILLPGVRVKKGAVLGSGALAAEDMQVPIGSVWLGSQRGKALNVAPPDASYNAKETLTPFGRAFYLHNASFPVYSLPVVVLYNWTWQALCTCYRNCPTALALVLCRQFLHFDYLDDHSATELFRLALLAYTPLYLSMCVFALSVDIAGKWFLLGRRMPGEYSWDQSAYCQRWQVYLTLQEIRRGERHKTGILDLLQGSAYLVWYFRLLGAQIGCNVCLFPNGGDPMFTEPDLVTIGDCVAIDDAAVIAHINTRGVFRLNPLVIGDGCVLKSMSRLLSGASMQPHSILLEHTLVLSGEEVGAGEVWQGWPTRQQISLREHRQLVDARLDDVSQENLRALRKHNSSSTFATRASTNAGADSAYTSATYASTYSSSFSSSFTGGLHLKGERQPLLSSAHKHNVYNQKKSNNSSINSNNSNNNSNCNS